MCVYLPCIHICDASGSFSFKRAIASIIRKICMTENNEYIREVVGVFHDHEKMEHAINELGVSGFDRSKISVLGSEDAVKKIYGTRQLSPDLLADDPAAPRSPKIKREELGIAQGVLVGGAAYVGVTAAILASGGVAAPALVTTAAIGGIGGGTIGAILAKVLGDEYATFFEKQIKGGGLLLWVRTLDAEEDATAQRIFSAYGAENVHMHQFNPQSQAS